MSLLKYVNRSLKCSSLRTAEYFKVRPAEFPQTCAYSSDSLSETDQPKPKPKKKARKSSATKPKKVNPKTETIKIETKSTEVLQVQPPSFPLEGVQLINHHGDDNIPKNHPSVERVDSANGSRYYVIENSEGSFRFPSVTTILEATQPPDMYFRLLNWRKGLVKEHGESKSIDIAQGIKQSGKNFHKVIEQALLDSATKDLISITPHVRDKTMSTAQQRDTNTLQTYVPPAYKPLQSIPIPARSIKPLVNTETIALGDEIVEDVETESLALSSAEDSTDVCIDDSITVNEERGTLVSDANIEEDTPPVVSANDGYMKSVEHVLSDIGNVCALESLVTHMELGYTGTFDCLAEYRGALSVIDWKTSSKPKPNLSDCFTYPLQAAAYAGAINQDPHYPYQVMNALIVVVYPNGDPCHAHFLSHDQLLSYWAKWLERLEHYQTQFARDLSQLSIHN